MRRLRQNAIASFNSAHHDRSQVNAVFYADPTSTASSRTFNVFSIGAGLGQEADLNTSRLIQGIARPGLPLKLVGACERDPTLRAHMQSKAPSVLLHSDVHTLEDDIKFNRFPLDKAGPIHILAVAIPLTSTPIEHCGSN